MLEAALYGVSFLGDSGDRLTAPKPLFSFAAPILLVATASALGLACGDSDSASSTTDEDSGTSSFSSPPSNPTGGPSGSGTVPGTNVPPGGEDGGPGEEADGGASGDAGLVVVPPGSCGTANPQKGFIASLTVRVGTANRTYAINVPAGYNGTRRYPLVFGFHGDGGNGAGYRTSFPIEAQGGTNAIFVWPNGTNANNGHSFDQDRNPPQNADVSFFDAMVTALSTTYCVDSARVYAHGMSGGAYFVNQLGRWRPSALRGIAPMSGGGPFGIAGADFDPATGNLKVGPALPAFIVHGQSDGAVNITEGQKSLAYWRAAAKSTAGQTATAPSPCQRQNGGTKPVIFCSIPGLGHTLWTGSAAGVWQFFSNN